MAYGKMNPVVTPYKASLQHYFFLRYYTMYAYRTDNTETPCGSQDYSSGFYPTFDMLDTVTSNKFETTHEANEASSIYLN